MEIYEILSQLMEERNLKVAEVARLCDLPDGTVRGIIKREQKDIALKVALKLSKGLGISIEHLNGMPEREKSPEELRQEKFNQYEHIVDKYRFISTHSPDGASVVDTVLDREYSIAEKLKTQKDTKADTKSPSTTAEIIPMRFLSYYQKMASAGRGEYLFSDIPTEVIAVPDTPLSRKAAFVIGVSGRSMEDTYFDGDKVLVEKTHNVPIGEIGIFIRETECFIKEVGENRLISHNKNKEQYPDIIPDERRIDTIGIVLGKVGE